jgi:hypothetical protein
LGRYHPSPEKENGSQIHLLLCSASSNQGVIYSCTNVQLFAGMQILHSTWQEMLHCYFAELAFYRNKNVESCKCINQDLHITQPVNEVIILATFVVSKNIAKKMATGPRSTDEQQKFLRRYCQNLV